MSATNSVAQIPDEVDHSKVFLFYLNFQGDVNRTALAAELPVEIVRALEKREDWAGKIEQYSALLEKDESAQQDLNRALNYVQTRQLSNLVDRMIVALAEKDEKSFFSQFISQNKDHFKFETKPITDLVKAAEALHKMSAAALGDTGGPTRGKGTKGGSKVGLNVANTLNTIAANSGLDAVKIVQNSLKKGTRDSETLPATAD